MEDIDKACYLVKFGATKTDSTINPIEKQKTAWHEAGHAIARHYLFPDQTIDTISIIPSEEGALGFVATNKSETHVCLTKDSLLKELIVCLAGREAEKRTPGINEEDGINSGASSDLKRATQLIYQAITTYGFDPDFGYASLDGFPNDQIKSELSQAIHKRTNIILTEAHQQTNEFLDDHSEALERLANELYSRESIDGFNLNNYSN